MFISTTEATFMSEKYNVIKLCTSIYVLVCFCMGCNGNLNAYRLPTKWELPAYSFLIWRQSLTLVKHFFVSSLNSSYDLHFLSLKCNQSLTIYDYVCVFLFMMAVANMHIETITWADYILRPLTAGEW